MATEDTETVGQPDPVRTLSRLSAMLSIIMAVVAVVIVWQRRDDAAPAVGDRSVTAANDDAPEYTFRVNAQNTRKPSDTAGMADIVADFELTERSGRKVTNKDLLGKPYVVCFVFTNCAGPCPRVTGQMKLLQDRFAGKPLRLVTITVDPKRDTPERLASYAEVFGADKEQWLFLTGEQNVIYPLIGNSFGLTVQEETGPTRKKGWEITHSTRVVHVDAAGRIRGKYDAQDDVEMAQLVRALQQEIAGLPKTSPVAPAVDEATSPIEAPVPLVVEPAAVSNRTPADEGT